MKENNEIINEFFDEYLLREYDGEIKSLGAWGGDFILASALDKNPTDYFKSKGFNTVLNFNELALV